MTVPLNDRSVRVVCLFGAGASVPAGLPHSVKLADDFKEEVVKLANVDSDARALKLLHFYIEGGIRFQKAKRGEDPSGSINIEEVAIAARHLTRKEDNPIAPFVAGWHPYLIELLSLRSGESILERYQKRLRAFVAEKLRVPTLSEIAYFDRLAGIARRFRGLDIFTLNYDCCVETSLAHECGISGDLEFIDGFDENGWNPNLYSRLSEGRCPIKLYKIHGSLDWVKSDEYGLVCLRKTPPDLSPDLYGMEEHLVFGTDSKLNGEQPFFSLAHLFFEALSGADVFVVIGYGFGDGYINSIIEDCLRSRQSTKIVLVGPHATQTVEATKLLAGSPNVLPIDACAKAILNDQSLSRKIDEVVKKSRDVPF